MSATPPPALIEEAVIGTILLYPWAFNQCRQAQVSADWFPNDACRAVWKQCVSLHEEGKLPDAVLIGERLKRLGLQVEVPPLILSRMISSSASSALSFGDYLRELGDALNARKREALWVDGRNARKAESPEREQEAVTELARTFIAPKPEQTIQEAAAAFDRELEQGVVPDLGLSTGFCDIDRSLGTLQPGELVIVAGRPGGGKSSLVRQIAGKTALEGRETAMVSTEMGAREIAIAAARQVSGIPWKLGAEMPKDMLAAFRESVKKISTLATLKLIPIRRLSPMMARFHAMMEWDDPPKLFVIDYIQQIDSEKGKGETLSMAIGKVSSALKAFALDYQVSVIATAQLNRDSVKDSEPQLVHLRDSGSLEQDADRVLMLRFTNEDDNESRYATVTVYQKKNRNGALGQARLTFDRWTTRFANHVPNT